MSRMVRDSETSGLRERLFFAQDMLRLLQQQRELGAARGRLLALRGAVVSHGYSVLVGLVRQAAKSYQVPDYASRVSLATLEQAFADAGVEAPEMALVARARRDRSDLICWLDQEMMALFGAAGLARRPSPRNESNLLAVAAEDPYAVLEDGDLQRLTAMLDRVSTLLEDCAPYAQEW
ncbi:hypothetical protein A167_01708 [Alcanivorax sp. S71-1-4]|uniref:hypothetical protein n=1 Tax=Alcanivorax sp. S71-1-4 TaxID=1177159 RepID=UPI00135B35D1|nr:hypothetical protein [Alcanivorax sp. S71-1-4]KAF0809425.1 hypothetical protein A167_01708 [Alcanivorax sp. S71-1-4]